VALLEKYNSFINGSDLKKYALKPLQSLKTKIMNELKILLFAIIILTTACSDKTEQPYPEPKTISEEIANIFEPMVNDKITVGVSVGIIKPSGDKEMFFFGEKDKNAGNKPDENTLYEIGSITKTMTAAVLAEMVINDELKLDDVVENYLPEIENFPRFNGDKITFKHLANHTSSLPPLPDNFDEENFDEDQPYLNYTKELMFGFLDGYTLPHAIGSIQEYSNFATGLLGFTLAKIKGESLETLFQNIVFDRVGMDNASTKIPTDNSNIAQPYDEDLDPVPMWDMSDCTLGAGGIKANLADMLNYLEANMGFGDSNLKETLALTHENTQTLNAPFSVGLAWNNIFKAEDNTTLTWHNGGTAGTVTVMGFVKELDMGFVVLFNTEIVKRSEEELIELSRGIDIIEILKKY